MVTPVTLALGTAAVVFVPAAAKLWWGAALRGADKSLTHTFSQSTREILYVPVHPRLRAQAKVVIDMFVNKLGDAAAAVLLIAANAFIPRSAWRGYSLITAVFILGWMVMNARLMKEYGGVVKENLRLSWPDADKLVLERVDVDAAKLVFDTLESRNQSSALYAMNLMDLVRRERLSPELKDLLNAETSRVRAGSLGTLLDAGGGPLFQDWDEAIEDEALDAEVREILALDVYRDVMKTRFEAWAERPAGGVDTASMEAAKALGRVPAGSPLAANLRPLLRSDSPEVVRYAPGERRQARPPRIRAPHPPAPPKPLAGRRRGRGPAGLRREDRRDSGGRAGRSRRGDAAVRALSPACWRGSARGGPRPPSCAPPPPATPTSGPRSSRRWSGCGGTIPKRLCRGTLFPPRSARRSPRPAA